MHVFTDQMKRAATLVAANSAGGFGRQSYKEKIRFSGLVQGSWEELKNFIFGARAVGYVSVGIVEE